MSCITCSKKRIVYKAGNIEGLAKHLSKKFGGDPGFFTKCVADEALADYNDEQRNGICAKAHKIAIGKWPTEGEHPKRKELRLKPKGNATITGIVIDNDTNADWILSLPGNANEKRIHEKLAKTYAKKKGILKNDR